MLLACPCESGKPYAKCCEVYHLGAPTLTAEALMRSRYSAYALCSENPELQTYLLQTWHPDTRPQHLTRESSIKWLGLEVKRYQLLETEHAIVEFVARYKYTDNLGGKAERLHETSRFMRIKDCWFYLDGNFD
jgi:SEC-C motif-containing protein